MSVKRWIRLHLRRLVVLPGMNGRELYDVLKRNRPTLKVLYMSGYSANVFGSRGILDERIGFLQKPFTRSSLSLKIRAVLDARGEAKGAAG